HTDIASQQRLANEFWKIEQSQKVSDMAARFVNQSGHPFLGVAVLLDQLAVAFGLLERIEVLALDVFDQREFGQCRFVDFANDRGNCMELRPLGSPPAPLSGNDHE